jgi:hypothetical protein
MRVTQVDPRALRAAVREAVADGAWAPTDVVASVASDFVADRAQIVATLWDLKEEGVLVYDASTQFPGFRPALVAAPTEA